MDSYERFRDKIDKAFPFPAPATESRVELALFAKLMSPEQAETACRLSPLPETAAAVASRLGRGVDETRRELDELVAKGVIFKVFSEDPLYCLAPMMPGIWEFQLGKFTPELLDLLGRYYAEILGRAVLTLKPPVLRVVPANGSISSRWTVLAYEEVESLIDKAGRVAIADCHCRTSKRMLGGGCGAPDDVCIVLDLWADYFEKTLNARRATKEQAKAALRRAADAGLVHCTTNSQEGPIFICNCCGCCCAALRGINELNIPAAVAIAASNFIARIAAADCTACGACVDRCHVRAISLDGDAAVVSGEGCIGCGACVSACATGAIVMERRDLQTTPVKTTEELLRRIAEGRAGATG